MFNPLFKGDVCTFAGYEKNIFLLLSDLFILIDTDNRIHNIPSSFIKNINHVACIEFK